MSKKESLLLDFRERDLQERINYLKLLIYFSKIDDDYDPHEAEFLKKLANNIDISPEDFNRAVDVKITEKEFEDTVEDFKDKKMIYSFFLDMVALTIVDGIIQDNEHKLLARVCNDLGLQLNFMHNLLYFSLSSSYTQLDELFEPIYQTFFTVIFTSTALLKSSGLISILLASFFKNSASWGS